MPIRSAIYETYPRWKRLRPADLAMLQMRLNRHPAGFSAPPNNKRYEMSELRESKTIKRNQKRE